MNFGPRANDAFKKQQPTYHVAPNFTTRPFPNGPLDLGTLVEDLRQYYPINQGATNRVPIPEYQRYVDTKEDINAGLKTSLGGEGSILAKVLDRSIGGNASLKGQKKYEDVYKIQKLETVYFYPQPSYIKKCLQLPDVKDYNEMADFKEPVYLITGLKIAWGATISTEHGRDFEGKVEGSVQAPGGLGDVKVGAGVFGESGMVSSFGKPADFVLGIQVQKIYHKRAFFVGEPVLAVKKVVKAAVLLGDDEPAVEGAGDDVEFTIEDLCDGEVEGLVSWTGKDSKGEDEIWLLPSDVV
ncbi:hypothetical protein BKA56DRAFT_571672 [Ilyonectria sp. MPI-CAGE-AT-0026]|nr:hypothetical protein BKA56DRAFT_571672 [Ilyonectria sp. MPI-CAGE-AT-0026]